MRINGDGDVSLDDGEPVPVKCRCGVIYQPAIGSECSDCPICGRFNHHQFCDAWERVDNETNPGQ